MAYERKSIRVLAGGLVTVAPGDVINDDDSQELVNWTTDSQGSLRSRRGHSLICSVSGVENQIRGIGGRYQNASGSVYKECAAVMAGVSGPTLVAWKGFVWSPPRKTDGTNDWRWIPIAPTAAPTIAAAAPSEVDVVTFDGGWTVTPEEEETTAESYDPTLTIHNQGASVWLLEKAAGADLGTNHSLDDVQKITVWSNKWQHVEGITFEVDVNDGTFEKDLYRATMSRKDLKVGKREEVSFYFRKRPLPVDRAVNDKKNYPSFERIGSTAGKDWATVGNVRIKAEFNDRARLRFNAWKNIGDVDNTLEGDDFMACYTYTTDAGHESNPSPFSTPITLNRNSVMVSGLVASADPQVTGMRIYLTGGTLPGVYSVTGPPIPFAATYTITATDDDLTGFNLQLENDHDDPPAATSGIGPYFDRIILGKGSRFYWSHQSKPYAFAGPDDETGGDWQPIEEGLGDILAMTMRPGTVWMHCQNGVAILEGDPGGPASSVHRASSQMGIKSPQGVVQAPEGDYCNFAEGIYLFNGGSAQEISRKIQTVFKGSWSPENAAMGYRNAIVWASDGNRTFRWDVAQDRWFEDSRKFTSFYSDGGNLIGALVSGGLVNLESGFTDDGAAFPVRWLSKSYDCDLKSDEKRFGDFDFFANTGGTDLLVEAVMEGLGQTVTLGTINSSGEERFVLPFAADGEGVDARRCAIRVTGNVSSECVLHSMVLWFYPKAREGKSFDTGEQSYGTHKAKIFRELVVDIDNQAAVAITVKSDRPQPMADRSTSHSIDATIDRRMQPVVFDESEIIGRLFRTVMFGESARCYGGQVLFQVIGTYLEGDEYYLSDVLDFDTERVKLGREIEIVYSLPTGSATLTVETDLPGGTLATRQVFTLSSTTGEETRKLRLPGTAKGRLWRFRVDQQGAMRIEAIRFFGKVVGMPNASAWTWFPLPVAATQDAIWSDVGFPPDQLG